ncbi:YsgD/CorL family protein [Escherichia coli]
MNGHSPADTPSRYWLTILSSRHQL